MKRPKRTCLTCGGVLRSSEECAARRCWLCALLTQAKAGATNGKG